ncbi:MAG: aminotransferase class V-fold PLP-dependent enzyme [Eubacteriales bacterium]|nr:aminotransferase class V-fold PLP-dependent enzyme [Eubacteriales bacterium]
MNDRKHKNLTDFLLTHAAEEKASFHMPGHKGGEAYRKWLSNETLDKLTRAPEALFGMDITEIPGADNLQKPEGLIREIEERYARLYDVRRSFLLINGSSCGLMAAIAAMVPRGGKCVVARNSHRSVFNGLWLAAAEAVYAYPRIDEKLGITLEVTPEEIERCLDEEPDAAAVVLTSPNYYGVMSDIKRIAEIVHERGKILIVDQAHGAHLRFFDEYAPYVGAGMSSNPRATAAEQLGADIVINSTHKTLATFTQSAIANICSDTVDADVFEEYLLSLESTSPSYLLMTSLDLNAQILENNGREAIQTWSDNVKRFRKEAGDIRGLEIFDHPLLDNTKILMDMSGLGLSGADLNSELMKRGVYSELTAGNYVMALTGIGNRRGDYDILLEALREIADEFSGGMSEREALKYGGEHRMPSLADVWSSVSRKGLNASDFKGSTELTPLSECVGRVSAAMLTPYPPGTPIVCPGEVISKEAVEWLNGFIKDGGDVLGVDGDGRVKVMMV